MKGRLGIMAERSERGHLITREHKDCEDLQNDSFQARTTQAWDRTMGNRVSDKG